MTNLLMNRLSVVFALCAMMFIVSCDKDEPTIDPGDGLNLSDGLYLQMGENDPSSLTRLKSENVSADDFMTQERTGYTAGSMYLEAGDYKLVEVVAKEIVSTKGGAMETIMDESSSCDHNTYFVVSTDDNGAAFSIPDAGLYRVAHDQQRSEITFHKIVDASILGDATEGGWGADTPLTGSVSSDGGSWSAEGVILRSGQWKIRYNCRWVIDRRDDPNKPLNDASNGYEIFTNFGGTISELVPGGSNIVQDEDGEYTITVSWDPRDGWSVDVERTGDAPVINFNPNDYRMAVIGDATNGADIDGDGTPDGWQSDRNLFHAEASGTHYWRGVVTFRSEGEWKLRANDDWNFNLGGELPTLTPGASNLVTPGEGAYYIVLSTADEGDTWNVTVEPMGWGLIGEGSPAMGWNDGQDVPLVAQGNVEGTSTYTYTGDFTTGGWKFRAAGSWDHNIGGDLSFLTTDGSNIELAAAGTYTVTLSFNGETYSATVE